MKGTLAHNITRYKLIEAHRNAVKSGNFELGRELLRLLRKNRTRIGLDELSWSVEKIAEECGCRIRYSRSYGSAEIRF